MSQERVELSVSDYSQIGPLESYLRLAQPDIHVTRVPGVPGANEQGALDVLMILADSSVLVAAIKVLPEFLRSRKPGLSVEVATKKKHIVVTATNTDEVMRILDRILDE